VSSRSCAALLAVALLTLGACGSGDPVSGPARGDATATAPPTTIALVREAYGAYGYGPKILAAGETVTVEGRCPVDGRSHSSVVIASMWSASGDRRWGENVRAPIVREEWSLPVRVPADTEAGTHMLAITCVSTDTAVMSVHSLPVTVTPARMALRPELLTNLEASTHHPGDVLVLTGDGCAARVLVSLDRVVVAPTPVQWSPIFDPDELPWSVSADVPESATGTWRAEILIPPAAPPDEYAVTVACGGAAPSPPTTFRVV
jgi:hypothetical protein